MGKITNKKNPLDPLDRSSTLVMKPTSILKIFNLSDESRLLEVRKSFYSYKKEILTIKNNLMSHFNHSTEKNKNDLLRILRIPNKLLSLTEKFNKLKIDLFYFVNTDYRPQPQGFEDLLKSTVKAFQNAKRRSILKANLANHLEMLTSSSLTPYVAKNHKKKRK
jgi:hypothetical protein